MVAYDLGPGTIAYVSLTNFLGWKAKRFDFEYPITVIYGSNGSGKSSIFQAISFVFGEDARNLRDDAYDEKLFIYSGATESVVTVALRNTEVQYQGYGKHNTPYKPEIFGDLIYVQRAITSSGFSRVVVGKLGSSGKVIPPSSGSYGQNPLSPTELRKAVFQHFDISPKNPLFILNQQQMKTIAGSNAKDLFDFIDKGYLLNEMARNLIDSITSLHRLFPKTTEIFNIANRVTEEYGHLKKLARNIEQLDNIDATIAAKTLESDQYTLSAMRIEVLASEKANLKIKQKYEEALSALTKAQADINDNAAKVAETNAKIQSVRDKVQLCSAERSSIQGEQEDTKQSHMKLLQQSKSASVDLTRLRQEATKSEDRIKSTIEKINAEKVSKKYTKIEEPQEPDLSKYEIITELKEKVRDAAAAVEEFRNAPSSFDNDQEARLTTIINERNNMMAANRKAIGAIKGGSRTNEHVKYFNTVFNNGLSNINYIPLDDIPKEGSETPGVYAPLGSWISLNEHSNGFSYLQPLYYYLSKHSKSVISNRNISHPSISAVHLFRNPSDFKFNRPLIEKAISDIKRELSFINIISPLEVITIHAGVVETYLFANGITRVFFAKKKDILSNEEQFKRVKTKITLFDEEANTYIIGHGSFTINVRDALAIKAEQICLTRYSASSTTNSIEDLEADNVRLLAEVNGLQKELRDIVTRKKLERETLEKLRKTHLDLKDELDNMIRKRERERNAYTQSLNQYNNELEKMRNDNTIAKLEEIIAAERATLSDIQQQIEDEEHRVEDRCTQLDIDRAVLTTKIEELGTQLKAKDLELENLRNEIIELEKRKNEISDTNRSSEIYIDCKHACQNLERDQTSAEAKLKSRQDSFDRAVKKFEETHPNCQPQFIETDINTLEKVKAQVDRDIKDLEETKANVDLGGYESPEKVHEAMKAKKAETKKTLQQFNAAVFDHFRAYLMTKANFDQLNGRVALITNSVNSEFSVKTRNAIHKELRFNFTPASNLHTADTMFQVAEGALLELVRSCNASILNSSDRSANHHTLNTDDSILLVEQATKIDECFNNSELVWKGGRLQFEMDYLPIDITALSGGEKSTTIVSLLTSLWAYSSAPFVAIDEFDVFMDDLKKTRNFEYLANSVLSGGKQAIFVTPNPVDKEKLSLKLPRTTEGMDDINAYGAGIMNNEVDIDPSEAVVEIYLPPRGTVTQ